MFQKEVIPILPKLQKIEGDKWLSRPNRIWRVITNVFKVFGGQEGMKVFFNCIMVMDGSTTLYI